MPAAEHASSPSNSTLDPVVRELVDAIQHDLLELHLVEVLAAIERAPTAETQPVAPTTGAPVPPNSEVSVTSRTRGINLSSCYEDIRRLTYTFGAAWCRRNNVDPEDLVSEVVLAIALRNNARGAWDPARGMALSTYILLIMRQRISNLVRSRSRLSRRMEDGGVEVDILGRAHLRSERLVEPYVTPTPEDEVDLQRAIDRARTEDGEALDAVLAGDTLRAAAARLGVCPQRVAKRRARLRGLLRSCPSS